MKRLVPAALVFLLSTTLACDTLLQGTYGGLCSGMDVPPGGGASLYLSTGPANGYANGQMPTAPETLRVANCQVSALPSGPNICCRHRDPVNPGISLPSPVDRKTYCQKPADCYIGNANPPYTSQINSSGSGDLCTDDLDCNVALRCNPSTRKCECAEDPSYKQCIDPKANISFCCKPSDICGMGSCTAPMVSPPDMTAAPVVDMRRTTD